MKKFFLILNVISVVSFCSEKRSSSPMQTALEQLHRIENNKSNERTVLVGEERYNAVLLLGATDDKEHKALRDLALNELLKKYTDQ